MLNVQIELVELANEKILSIRHLTYTVDTTGCEAATSTRFGKGFLQTLDNLDIISGNVCTLFIRISQNCIDLCTNYVHKFYLNI